MPLVIKMPRNQSALAAVGPYPRALNVLDRKQTAVQRQLRRAGLAGYEPSTQATLLAIMQLAPRGSAFFDIGAHIGLYSAMVSAIFGSRGHRVYAFEPSPETAQICRKLRDINGLDFGVVEKALGREPSEAVLHLSAKAETSNSLNPTFRSSIGTVTVPVSTVDLFTATHHVDPWLIKIDVETYEPMVLAGSLQAIERARPWVICEILDSVDHELLAPVLSDLADLGYTFYRIDDRHPWSSSTVDGYRYRISGSSRDWLFAPTDLSSDFFKTVRAWSDAIAKCGPETNLLIPGGVPFPEGWNAPYPRRRWWHLGRRD